MVDWGWKYIEEETPKFTSKEKVKDHTILKSDPLILEVDGIIAIGIFCKVEKFNRVPYYYFIVGQENVTEKTCYWQYPPKT